MNQIFLLLGRIYHAMGKYTLSIQYLQQGLLLAEELQHVEEEAKIRHRLGLAFWGQGQLKEAQNHLFKAAELFEMIRRGAHVNSDYKLSLFDLQTACYQALQVWYFYQFLCAQLHALCDIPVIYLGIQSK